jgi:hypothetical protein
MMTLQEIISSLDSLSVDEQDYLVELIRQRREEKPGLDFWECFQQFRATIEQEGIIFDDEDFANLRDRSVGREVNL